MVDIQTISIAIASASVVAGVIYYSVQIRHQTKARRTEIIWKNYQSFNSKEFLEAMFKVWNLEFVDYNDFVKKYGPPWSENPVSVALALVGNMFEGAGELLHKGLADYETVSNIPTGITWEKIKPIAEGARKQYNFPHLWIEFEYLYNEMKKREQAGVKNG
jgi:hypothetical protein